MLPARQQGGHQEGSHLSLTWVVFPILFSLGDVSTDVANPFSDSSRIRTYDRLLRRQLLYPAELLSLEYPHIIRHVGNHVKKEPSSWCTHRRRFL